jgi:CspA family cold shock protein
MTGTVKWFNDTKGYGFLQADNGQQDIFVHYTSLIDEGFKTLAEGQRVSFDLVASPKGPIAEKVRKIFKPKRNLPNWF